jgi:hypothetical protein
MVDHRDRRRRRERRAQIAVVVLAVAAGVVAGSLGTHRRWERASRPPATTPITRVSPGVHSPGNAGPAVP